MISSASLPPDNVLWRVARPTNPLGFRTPDGTLDGRHAPRHRFDSALGNFPTAYFATTPETAFAETLLPRQPLHPEFFTAEDGFAINQIEAEWRAQHRLVRAELPASADAPLRFADLEHSQTVAHLDQHLRPLLAALGVERLDLSDLHGPNRLITCSIAQWLHDVRDSHGVPHFAGARYVSKYGDGLECWVLFEHANPQLCNVTAIDRTNDALLEVCQTHGLTVY